MIRSRKVITKRFRTVLSNENSACISYLHHYLKSVFSDNFHMFRSNLIRCFNCFIHIFCNKDISKILQRFFDDLFSGKNFQITFNLFLYILCQFCTGSNEDCRSHLIVFCLRKKICCYIVCICSFICKDKDLTWTSDGINAHMSINSLFCKGYKNVARSYDLVYLWDTCSTISKCSDCLCTTNFIDLISACFFGSNQSGWIYFTVFSRRCGHNDVRYSCHFCRHNIH